MEVYRLQTRTWENLTELNLARHRASCCVAGRYLYIFGGALDGVNFTNQFESLNLSALEGDVAVWEAFRLEEKSCFTPRIASALTSINDNKLIILGGNGFKMMSDVMIYEKREPMVLFTNLALDYGDEPKLEFHSFANQIM